MTSSNYPYEEEWAEAEYWDAIGYGSKLPVELVLIMAVVLVAAGLGWAALKNYAGATAVTIPGQATEFERRSSSEEPLALPLPDAATIIAPYDEYIVTQGVHGLSYGHMAIDIAAGKGAAIKSPISGFVSQYYFDAIGNPTLVIENDRYEVTLLHGVYTVEPGEALRVGDLIGTESNLGNTRDMQGNSCRNRDCGYHTHLNVFDKKLASNIDPLDVIGE